MMPASPRKETYEQSREGGDLVRVHGEGDDVLEHGFEVWGEEGDDPVVSGGDGAYYEGLEAV